MAKYEKYAEYKDSGIEWLGEIPNHWGISRLKYIADIFGRIGFRGYTVDDIVDEGEGALVLSPSNILGDQFSLEKRTYLSWKKYYESPEIMVELNDILLVKTGSTYGKSTIILDKQEPMTINPQMALLKNIQLEPRFLYYLFQTNLYKAIIDVSNTGSGMPTMTQENINSFPIPYPDFQEALKIANFLDHETAQIHTLIAKQEKLIELLKEKRQAVISHAVTKGLNPDVAMKDSGVEWLGQVPEHWEIPKLLHITTRIGDGLHSTPLYQEGTGYYFINGNNLVDGQIFIGETAKEVPESEFIKHQVTLDNTTVLLSINGTIGKVALFNNEPVILGKSASYMNCCPELAPSFLANYLTTSQAKNYYDLEVTGTTIYNLSLNSIRNMKIPLPPTDEQKNIVSFIAEQYSKYEKLIQSSEKQNELLKERRTALISSAVTGKIDVRHHASRPSGNDKKQTEGI